MYSFYVSCENQAFFPFFTVVKEGLCPMLLAQCSEREAASEQEIKLKDQRQRRKEMQTLPICG